MSKGAEKKSNENLWHKSLENVRQPSAAESLYTAEASDILNWTRKGGKDIGELKQIMPFLDSADRAAAQSMRDRMGTGALQLGGQQNEGYLAALRGVRASEAARAAAGAKENAFRDLYGGAMGALGNAVQFANQRKTAELGATTNIYGANVGKPSMWNSVIQGAATVGAGAAAASDIRLKSAIKPLKYGLDEVLQLQPVWYVMDGQEQVGFIAQDIEKIMPELVVDIREGVKGVMYGNMAAVLANAIQELHDEVVAAQLSKKQGRIRKLLSSVRSWLKSKL